jgi:hypothetical protein
MCRTGSLRAVAEEISIIIIITTTTTTTIIIIIIIIIIQFLFICMPT